MFILNDMSIVWYGNRAGHQYEYININNINNNMTPYKTNGNKEESNIVLSGNCRRHHNAELKT